MYVCIYIYISYGMLIPTDFHIFQRGWNHQPSSTGCYLCSFPISPSCFIGEIISDERGHVDNKLSNYSGISRHSEWTSPKQSDHFRSAVLAMTGGSQFVRTRGQKPGTTAAPAAEWPQLGDEVQAMQWREMVSSWHMQLYTISVYMDTQSVEFAVWFDLLLFINSYRLIWFWNSKFTVIELLLFREGYFDFVS